MDQVWDMDYRDFREFREDLSKNPPTYVLLKAFFTGEKKGKVPAGPPMRFRTKEDRIQAKHQMRKLARQHRKGHHG